jgi:tetratricopeptide (TPR) repeat protein
MSGRIPGLLLTLKRLVVALSLTASVSAVQPSAQTPRLSLDAYPAEIRADLARPYENVRAHPDDANAVGSLGRVLQAWEQWETAHEVYTRAITLAPASFDWHYLDACVLDRLARPKDAVAHLREALKIRPDYVAARVRLADALLSAGQLGESGTIFAALAREPQAEPLGLFGLGRILAAEGKHEEAVQAIQQALALFPEWGAAHYSLALSLRALGRRDEAQQALQRHVQYGTRWPGVADPVLSSVSDLRNDSAARFRRARSLADQGDLNGAITEFESVLADDKSSALAHSSLVKLYGRTGNWAKADEHYRAAVALGSGLAELHYDYGVLLGLQQKWDEAQDAYRRAIAINPVYPEAHNNLGQILERNRQFEAALAEYRSAASDRPTFRLARLNVGRMLIGLGRLDEAITELQKITQPRDAEAPRYLFALSTAYVRAGRKDEGIRWANDARQLALHYGDTALAAAIERDLALIR